MKKFTKISLIVAAVMLGLGIVLCGISSMCGVGIGTLRLMANEGVFDWGNWHIRSNGIYYSEYDPEGLRELERLEDVEQLEDVEKPAENGQQAGMGAEGGSTAVYDSASVKNLHFEIGAARVLMQESRDADKITVDLRGGDEKYLDSTLEGDTLTVAYDKQNVTAINNNAVIIVSIPRASVFDELQFFIGAASIEMDDVFVSCENLLLELGAGKMEAERLTVLETAEVSVDAGEVILEDSSFKDVNVSCAMGNIELSGSVDGNLTGNCEMGNIEIDLLGREQDYNYDLSCAMGKLTVNGRNYSGVDQEHYDGNAQTKGTIQLSCEMGSIDLEVEPD